MHSAIPFACFLSVIRPPGVQFENSLLQIAPVDKAKCPFIKDTNDIEFQLYTRHNPTVYQELIVNDDERLFASNMDFHAPTVVFFHAFMENPGEGSGVMIREAYMLRGDTNVIMVDAQRLEAGPWYVTAAENTWFIGRFAAQFIDYLVSRGLDLSKTHLIGHSLGAQAAGVAGAALKSGRVSRITGLDPALPLFAKLPLEQKLDASDATFVDVIHTDAGIFGVHQPVGHADFYPNGGISPQPGCELEVVLPQQMLLNKCNNRTQPMKYHTFYLQGNKPRVKKYNLELKLTKLFNNLRTVKPDRTGKHRTKPVKSGNLKTKSEETYQQKHQQFYFRRENFDTKNSKSQHFKNQEVIHQNVQIETENDSNLENKNLLKQQIENPELYNQNVKTQTQTDAGDIENKRTQTKQIKIQNLQNYPSNRENKNTQTKQIENLEFLHQNDQPQKANLKSHVVKRQKRFLPFLKRSETNEQDNFLFKMLEFLIRNRKSVVPVFSVMREINTLVKSANGELNHVSKERNNYIGAAPPLQVPVSYSLELGNENKAKAFVKRLFGFNPNGDRLTIGGSG